MSIEIKIFHEDAGGAMMDLKRIAEAMGMTFMASQGAAQAEPIKTVKAKKNVAPMVEQPNGAETTTQEQMFPEKSADPLPPVVQVEPAKAEKPAEPDAEEINEAACRAALQHLHSVHAGKKDSPGGIKAAQGICAQFSVKKVSELKPEQWAPFHAACMAQALEVQKQ
jgi:hypothetical protein